MESRGIAWPCCPTTSCVWRSLPYRALGATAPDLRPPGRRSPPPRSGRRPFMSSHQRSRGHAVNWIPPCSAVHSLYSRPSYSRGAPKQHCTMPSSRPKVGVLTAHVGSPDYVFDISAHIPHTAASLAVEVEMRPRCGRDAAEMRPVWGEMPPGKASLPTSYDTRSQIDTCPRHTLALTPSP